MNILAQIATVLLGLLGGGLLLLGLGFLPYWQSLDPAEFTALFSANVPLIAAAMKPIGFSAAGITWLATGLAMWKKLPTRHWLLAASVFALCMLATFPVYFVGANAALAAGEMSAAAITAELVQWQQVHWVRTVAAILACLCAVRAGYARTPAATTYADQSPTV